MSIDKFEGAGQFYMNGRLIAEASSVRYKLETNDNVIKTMTGGVVGFSDGATVVTISSDLVVPKAGYEEDWHDACQKRKTIRAVVKHAGKRRTAEGRIMSYESTNGVDTAAGVSIEFTGKTVGSL